MIKQKVLTLLVLLAAVVTGAWAQEQSETITTTATIVEGTHFTISNNNAYADTDGMIAVSGITVTAKNGETITKVVISCTYGPNNVNDGTTSVSSGTKEITNDGGTITVTGVNASTFTFTCSHGGPEFVQFVVYYTEASAAPAGYTVSIPQDTPDAEKWTAKAGQGQYQQLPLSGVAAGTAVTVKYNGKKRVKSVKAVKEAAPAAEGHALSASVFGEIVGSDGKAYAVADKDNLPSGVTAAGMVAYKDGSSGLAIALADEANTMDWSTAKGATGAAAHTPKVTGYSWNLPIKYQWNQMFGAGAQANNADYTNLNNALAAAGGDSSKLQVGNFYWSSTSYDEDNARYVYLGDSSADWNIGDKGGVGCVRACIAFYE